MKYTFLNNSIVYEHEIPKEYVLSNLELTMILKDGMPHRLFSSKSGLLIEFLNIELQRPAKCSLWPNGCEFESGRASWKIFTSAFSRSILWEIAGTKKLSIEFKAPLEKEFKVPFGATYSFRSPLSVAVNGSEMNISGLVTIETLNCRIENFQRKNDRSFKFELTAEEGKNLKIRFTTEKSSHDEQKENLAYNEFLKRHVPENVNEPVRSLALFALHTALSNWKDLGENFAFVAGVNYSFPPRTYFRDSFWTCLSVLGVRTDLVRNQILTLASAVHDDGCPSGVMFLTEEEKTLLRELRRENRTIMENVRYNNDWWSDHHDSGFLFVLLLSKYVNVTEDVSILKERVDSDTLLDKVVKVLRHAEKFVRDDLFMKPFDCKDWADNVFRNGYVSYDAALHVAALREASKLLSLSGMHETAKRFEEDYLRARRRFNEVLFDDGKGYFVDFIGSYVEDHISLDTVVSIVFDVADERRAISSLLKMEQFLETRNNHQQPYGDWGVMTVWPHYRKRSHLFGKSAFPYRYHNGGCWPYLSCAYALAKARFGLDYTYPLLSWWRYSLERGWVNLVEYYSPCFHRGSLHQAWSGYAAAVISQIERGETEVSKW
ncbi:MAG: amylo-alpha-1,6-glucosidase [Thermotoga caldifontis]|uniref:amylo-alpha-1,6-glucosidase n=1 Tax=Thermotoga caldifontis TaxID=1508419 RepID=UPI003C7D96B8